MEIKSTRFDMTDSFAPLKQRATQAETLLLQLPPARREQLLAEVWPSLPLQGPSPSVEAPARMVTVKVDEWDGGPVGRPAYPTAIARPRRLARHIPWQWRVIVIGIRVGRRLRRSARKQLRQTLKASRRFLRRVLPRQKTMRGARAR